MENEIMSFARKKMIELEVIMLKEKKIRFRPIWLISSQHTEAEVRRFESRKVII